MKQLKHSANSFTKTFILFSAGVGLLLSATAWADHGRHRGYDSDGDGDYRYYSDMAFGDVIEARPIYQQVAVDEPREHCHVETVAREEVRHQDNFAGTVVGGLVGAALGHELGNGRGDATAVGGLIGASIGNSAGDTTTTRYRDQEVCRQAYHTHYEQRIIGYDVKYSYNGRIYTTRTDHHPGDRIALNVSVRPRDE